MNSPKELVTLPGEIVPEVPPLWTLLPHCVAFRSRPRSNEITVTDRRFLLPLFLLSLLESSCPTMAERR